MAESSAARARRYRAAQQAKRRLEYPDQVIGYWKESMRSRIDATKKLVSFRACRGDMHGHSTFSDGVGTVAEIKRFVDSAGLDFYFLTDHQTVAQKRLCVKYKNFWWGQEPGTQHQHLGILNIDRAYRPKHDLAYDYNRVKELGGFPFIPHPTGWFRHPFSQEQIDALDLLGEEFTIEIINGANQIYNCFDETDAHAIVVWDHHLCQGKRVVAIGNTDAHLPQAVGDVWTGVFCPRLTKKNVIDALWQGHCFVSDAPLLNLCCGNANMGDVVRKKKGANLTLRGECADSYGLATIRIIKDGKVFDEIDAGGKQKFRTTINDTFNGGKSYYRLECFARDDRRAYSNPIYVWDRALPLTP